jgi:MFS family permease
VLRFSEQPNPRPDTFPFSARGAVTGRTSRAILPLMSGSPSVFHRLVGPYRGLGSSLWSMFFATMINRFGDFVGPFLALYVTRRLGYDSARAGLLVAITFAAAAGGALVSGRVADRVGRKRALMACHTLAALVNLVMSFMYGLAWAPWLLVVESFFRGGARPLISALIADLAPPARRKEAFGLQYWSINVGVAVGPLVAAFLFDHSLPWLFRGDALCTLASVGLVALGIRAPGRCTAGSNLERRDERGAIRAFMARPILLCYCLLGLASSITYSQTGFALPLTLSKSLGSAGTVYFGAMLSLNAIIVIIFSLPLARALRSRSPLSCYAASGAIYVLGFGMLALPLGRIGFAISTFVWTIAEIVAAVNIGIFVAKHSPANWRASFQSFTGVFLQGGWSLGPLVAGPLIAGAGFPALWSAVAAMCGLWALGAFAMDRWDRSIVARPEAER